MSRNDQNIRASLTSQGKDEAAIRKIAGVKTPLTSFKHYAEKNSINLGTNTAPAMLKKHASGLIEALTSSIASFGQSKSNALGTMGVKGAALYGEMENIVRTDIAQITGRMNSEINLYAESMLAGTYQPFQLALLPHVYLETIANNSRFLMPTKEYTSEQLPPRKAMVRQLVIGNEKFRFPACLKDPEVMRKMRNQGSEHFEIKLNAPFDKVVNLFTASGVGAAGQDTLIPQLDIIGCTYNDGVKDIEVKLNVSSTAPDANNYTAGRIFKDIPVPATAEAGATPAHISGEINFATGDAKLLFSDEIKSVTLKAYKSGAYNRTSASVDVTTESIIQVIKNRINMIFDYDPGSMQNFLSLENIDGVLEGQSIIFDVVLATKDQFAFDTLNGLLTELKAEKAAGFDFEDGSRGFWENDFYTMPGVNSGFRPTSQEQWNKSELGIIFKNLHVDIAMKFNSTQGMQYNWWANPKVTSLFVDSSPIITKNEQYGGMMTDYAVFGIEVAGAVAKLVSTERATEEEGFKCVPYSNMESQPTFEFQQAQHALYTDGTFRNPSRPHMPAIAYYDYYDVNYVYGVIGAVNIKEAVKPA